MTNLGFFHQKSSTSRFHSAHERQIKQYCSDYAEKLRAWAENKDTVNGFDHNAYPQVMLVYNLGVSISSNHANDMLDAILASEDVKKYFQVENSKNASALMFAWKHGDSSLPCTPEAVTAFLQLIADILESRAPTVEVF